jgi:hypothetical protein
MSIAYILVDNSIVQNLLSKSNVKPKIEWVLLHEEEATEGEAHTTQ